MIYLLLSIVCSTLIYAIFKLFDRFGIDTFQAIVANYYVASGFGFLYCYSNGNLTLTGGEPWLWIAALVGALFISLFYVMALTSQIHGVSITSIATKMSMVIPAAFFIIFDPSEWLGLFKIIGIMLGIAAVLLATSTKNKTRIKSKAAYIPIILFVGSGLLDLLLAYAEKNHLQSVGASQLFVPVPFAIAGLLGSSVLIFKFVKSRQKLHPRSLLAGIILGLVNYGSIYFLLLILGSGLLDRSSAIPANNMGVVLLSTMVGFAVFRERLTAKNKVGIVLALLAIACLTFQAI